MNRLLAGALAFEGRGAPRAVAARGLGGQALKIPLACCWLLMLMTFSPPGRDPLVNAGAVDSIALAKLAARGVVLGALVLLVGLQRSVPRCQPVLRLLLPWFAFAGWAVLSTGWSSLKSVSAGQSGSLVVLLLLALNIALRTEPPDIEQVLKHLTWALLVACLSLLAIYFALPSWKSLSREGTGLMHATNGAATASIGCVLLCAGRLLFGWKWSRTLFVPGLAVFGAALILAHSRTAIGVTCLVVVGLAACIAPFGRAVAMAGLGVGGIVYLAIDLELGLTDAILDALGTYSARGQTPAQIAKLSGREEMWTAMWNSFLESPWLGHGYFVSSAKGEIYVWYVWTNWTAHNFWLQVLVTTGMVGAVLMAWGMVGLMIRLLRTVARGDVDWKFGVLVAAVVVWQIGWGLNNESFAGPLQPESVAWFVILGLAIGRFADALLARRNSGSREQHELSALRTG